MRAEQVGKTTLQEASRVWEMEAGDLEAAKKDMDVWSRCQRSFLFLWVYGGGERGLTWRSRLKGMQSVKVSWARKEFKKSGQLGSV